MSRHRRLLLCLVVIVFWLASPDAALARDQGDQWFDSYRTFSVYLENDALAKWRDETTDESFTQGLRMVWEFGVWPEWAGKAHHRLSLLSLLRSKRFATADDRCTPQRTRISGACGTVSFGLGQTIYSPVDIITTDLQPQDQPFAGWLFASMGLHARHGRWQSGTELVVGVTGPPSFARNTQSLAHWTWSQGAAKPGGWDNQLKRAGHAGLMQTYAVHAVEYCRKGQWACSGGIEEGRIFDLSPRVELIGTSAMLRASGGAMVRLGYGFPDALGQRIPATASARARSSPGNSNRNKWWFAVFAGGDWRAVGHNSFLSGSYADGGANGWRERREIEPRTSINEGSAGLSFGNALFTVSAQAVSRSLEWDPIGTLGAPPRDGSKRHSYLALMIGLNSGS